MQILQWFRQKFPQSYAFFRGIYFSIKVAAHKEKPIEEVFTQIKCENRWGSSESVSGGGSEIEQTRTLITELPRMWKAKGIKSILDIPCGDFNWMKEIDLSAFDYIGGDIVDELISENAMKYSSKSIKFMTLNLVTDILPRKDLIFVRDCFVHLAYKDIRNAIANIKKSGCKYLMTTTFPEHHNNHDIVTGEWRTINLQDKPFNFPKPEYTLIENCTENYCKDKAMGLWLIEHI